MSGTVILAGVYRLGPGGIEAATDAIAAVVAATRAEPGCLAYGHAQDAVDPGLMRVFEVFQSEAALALHRSSPHMASWRARWAELGLHGRDLTVYRVASSEAG